eukprot:GHVS01009869.1.p1 GENE.GHVS01009869.1~~GHVS01009869.1.p1  ORF type:complete len:368 (+),score=87.43 GHVS01009869.1:92-1105(+)
MAFSHISTSPSLVLSQTDPSVSPSPFFPFPDYQHIPPPRPSARFPSPSRSPPPPPSLPPPPPAPPPFLQVAKALPPLPPLAPAQPDSFSSRLLCLERLWTGAVVRDLPFSISSLLLPQYPPHRASCNEGSETPSTPHNLAAGSATSYVHEACTKHDQVVIAEDGLLHIPLIDEEEGGARHCLCLSLEEWETYTKHCEKAVRRIILLRDCRKQAHESLHQSQLWKEEVNRVAALELLSSSKGNLICRQDEAMRTENSLIGVDDMIEELHQQKEALKLEKNIQEIRKRMKLRRAGIAKGKQLLEELMTTGAELKALSCRLERDIGFSAAEQCDIMTLED